MENKFIVAEVSKSWGNSDTSDIISVKFEEVINTNLKRGYSLKEWKMHSHMKDDMVYVETIIAIFEKTEKNG